MLTCEERKGVQQILAYLSDDEVNAVVQTITLKQIVSMSRKEAIEAVISFSENSEEFLKRKKIKREYLFKYLAQNRIEVSPKAEKHHLISETLKLWKNRSENNAPGIRISKEEKDEQSQALCNKTPSNIIQKSTPEIQQLSMAFIKWFYELLNSENPSISTASSERFSIEHFYPNCQMKLTSITTEFNQMEYGGRDLITKRLLALVVEEGLIFSPNISLDGIRGEAESHGLVKIMACGTVHQQGSPVGIFEQQFGLISEPMSDIWKIKFTNLHLVAKSLGQQPTLETVRENLPIEFGNG